MMNLALYVIFFSSGSNNTNSGTRLARREAARPSNTALGKLHTPSPAHPRVDLTATRVAQRRNGRMRRGRGSRPRRGPEPARPAARRRLSGRQLAPPRALGCVPRPAERRS